MKLAIAAGALGVLGLGLLPQAAWAAGGGKLLLEQRLRYERVDQAGFADQADALTLRTRLGYQTPQWRGLQALVEGENVARLAGHYNSTVNGRTALPVVADPSGTELNRAQVSWTSPRATVTLGRQRIILGQARFVGNVGFRQNEQTFDAARLDLRPAKDVAITYAYIDQVRRIYGPNSAQGRWDSDSHIVQADLGPKTARLSLYGQWLDLRDAPALSSATLGLRLAGEKGLWPGMSAVYEAEFARQSDNANAPSDFSLDYAALGAGLKTAKFRAGVGYERLEGDGKRGFQTPLATLHAYQGHADAFLTTPADGLSDINLKAGGGFRIGKRDLKWSAAAHDFSTDDFDRRLGRELDVAVQAPVAPRLTAEVKAARFEGADRAYPDRTKVWVSLEFKL